MAQCQCACLDQRFSRERAARELNRYRQNGPAAATSRLIAALQAEAIMGMTLLDIGSGIGVIPQLLLRSGVSQALDVDASAAYMAAARTEAERLGLSERMRFVQGNFVALAETIPVTDIVTLDRVICCFDDMPALVGLSAARAGRLYGVVLPRDTWWMRLLGWARNGFWTLMRSPMRFFIYAIADVDAVVRPHQRSPSGGGLARACRSSARCISERQDRTMRTAWRRSCTPSGLAGYSVGRSDRSRHRIARESGYHSGRPAASQQPKEVPVTAFDGISGVPIVTTEFFDGQVGFEADVSWHALVLQRHNTTQ